MAADWRQRGPSCLWVLGHVVDGSVLTGRGSPWKEQVFGGMMGQTWVGGRWSQHGKRSGRKSLLRSRPLSTNPRTRHGPPPQATPVAWRERTWASWRELGPSGAAPLSPRTLGSHLPARHSNGVQQGAEGCRLSAPELAPPAGSGCRASHPPGCLALTQPPGTNNPPR